MIDTLAIFVGGLGGNQWRSAPSPAFGLPPNVRVDFLDDVGYMFGKIPDIIGTIKQAMAEAPTIKYVIVWDHSMGWICGAKASIEGLVTFLGAADPVGIPTVSTDAWPHPNGERQPGMFAKALPTAFITQLNVTDGPPIVTFPCSHNDLIHDAQFIATVQATIIRG